MAGFVIHIAIANEYIRKHPNEINDKEEFIKGVIAPDMVEKSRKGETHYGESSSVLYLRKYLEKNELNTDYNKGYFLHLVTDYIFYNKILETFSYRIYNDYDILNEYLMKKYKVILPDEVKYLSNFKNGKTELLHKKIADNTIEVVSNYLLENIKQEIINSEYIEKWDNIRPLKIIK